MQAWKSIRSWKNWTFGMIPLTYATSNGGVHKWQPLGCWSFPCLSNIQNTDVQPRKTFPCILRISQYWCIEASWISTDRPNTCWMDTDWSHRLASAPHHSANGYTARLHPHTKCLLSIQGVFIMDKLVFPLIFYRNNVRTTPSPGHSIRATRWETKPSILVFSK